MSVRHRAVPFGAAFFVRLHSIATNQGYQGVFHPNPFGDSMHFTSRFTRISLALLTLTAVVLLSYHTTQTNTARYEHQAEANARYLAIHVDPKDGIDARIEAQAEQSYVKFNANLAPFDARIIDIDAHKETFGLATTRDHWEKIRDIDTISYQQLLTPRQLAMNARLIASDLGPVGGGIPIVNATPAEYEQAFARLSWWQKLRYNWHFRVSPSGRAFVQAYNNEVIANRSDQLAAIEPLILQDFSTDRIADFLANEAYVEFDDPLMRARVVAAVLAEGEKDAPRSNSIETPTTAAK